MTTNSIAFSLFAGDDLRLTGLVKETPAADSPPQDLTGYTPKLLGPDFELNGSVLVAAAGTFAFDLPAATTAAYKPGLYPFRVRMIGARSYTVLAARFRVRLP